MDKKAVDIYTMEYYSAIKKSTFESVLMRWIKPTFFTYELGRLVFQIINIYPSMNSPHSMTD